MISSLKHNDLSCIICTCAVLLVCYFRLVQGHGHLVDPPSRSSMWQEGFKTPPNYNQNQLNCGGFYNHWVLNSGKCGICGDPYQSAVPRDNESGGKYGKGIITRTYSQGQKVTIKVLVTANHEGWFEFRLCPNGSPTTPVTQGCLDKYVLQLADGSGSRYALGSQERSVYVDVLLPPGVTCTQCVLQWKWRAGNNYGRDQDGTNCRGCGPQEEFYGCSDIAITSGNNGGQTQAPITMAPVRTTKPTVGTPRPQTTAAPIITFPPITVPHYTNAVQTYGTNYPTMRPINFPLFTTPSTTSLPTAPPITTKQPIVTQPPFTTSPTNNGGAVVTLPAGFVPISRDPAATLVNPTVAPVRTNPPVPFAPIRTNPPFTYAPIRTNAPYITQTPRPTIYRPPSTTSRLQIVTTPTPKPVTIPNIFYPQTTKPSPQITLKPFTLFPPFIVNHSTRQQSKQTTPSFFRPQTIPRPVFTFRPIITTPFFRPQTTQPPIIATNPQTPAPSTFFRHPTTKAPRITQPAPVTSQLNRCFAINSWKGVGELEYYCQVQCNTAGGVCPPAFCQCQP